MAHIDTTPLVRASVWIRPNGEAFERLVKAIRVVRQRVEGPPVQPHVSLLGGIETSEAVAAIRLKRLATRLKPFQVRLGKLEWRDEYYRAFYAAVEPNEMLELAHKAAHDAFEMMPPDPFEPHVSLAYGKLDDATRKALAEALDGRLDVTFTATAVCLVNASESVPIPEWRTVAEQPLQG